MKVKIEEERCIHTLKSLHHTIFPSDSFMSLYQTRVWTLWHRGEAVAFCSYRKYSDKICFFSRAGVLEAYQGKGLHVKMIKHRLKEAQNEGYHYAITYTTKENAQSFNNLQKCGFKLYLPEYAYAGNEMLYWIKIL